MSTILDPALPRIIYSVTSKRTTEGELFIRQHIFDYILSGSSVAYFDGKYCEFKSGEFRFVRKNRLCRFIKDPAPAGLYRSISICIDQPTLEQMQHELNITSIHPVNRDSVFLLKPNNIFNNYIDSLLPYLENGDTISDMLLKTKIKEAVLIFLETNLALRNMLFDFSEPGKIDLEAYMNEHYRFNGELHELAYLTGRSLSTFKRDFYKIYGITPNKWLIKKRLDEAYYLLKEKKWKSTEVFMEVGFKDYAHFSTAFKKHFGAPPSLI